MTPDRAPQKIFQYVCQESDVPNLPTQDIGSGSIAYVVDKSEIYIYHEAYGWNKFLTVGGSGGDEDTWKTLCIDVMQGGMRSLDVPEVETIRDYCFYSETLLTSVSLPDVTYISNSAFQNCTHLTTAYLPSCLSIGSDAFRRCLQLSDITLSEDISDISSNAFLECTNLTSFVISDSLTHIGSDAFARSGLTTLSVDPMSATLEEIQDGAFSRTKLTEVDIPASVMAIYNDAFASINTLQTVRFYGTPDTIDEIFSGDDNLTDIYVPWSDGEVDGAPWGAENATIHYDTVY